MQVELLLAIVGAAVSGLLAFSFVKYQCNQNTNDIRSLKDDLEKSGSKTEILEDRIMVGIDKLKDDLHLFKLDLTKQISDIRHYNKWITEEFSKKM
jgi:hypothetical protein